MAFLALLAYLVFVLIRPQEFMQVLIGMPLVKFALIIATLFMLAEKKRRFDAPQNMLLFWLIPVIFLSGMINAGFWSTWAILELYLTSIFLPFLVVQNLINSEAKQKTVMIVLIISALVMVHDGMAQKASEIGVGWSGAMLSQGTRITYLGIFSDPNDVGMFLVMVLPLALFFFAKANTFSKLFFIIPPALIVYGVYLTNSRGALIGLMSQVGLWFFIRYGFVKSLIVGAIAAPLAFIAMSMFRAIDADEESAEGRLDAWYEGFQLFFWKPVLGVGMGRFTEYHHLTAHNSFVLVFTELGSSGYFLWIGFLTFSALMLLMLWRTDIKGNLVGQVAEFETSIAKALSFSLVGYLATAFFLSRSYTPMLYIFGAMFVATFYRATGYEKGYRILNFKDYVRKVFLVFSASIVLIYLTVRILL